MKKVRRHFTREYKLAAVEAMNDPARSHQQLAGELGIAVSLLYKWRAALDAQPQPDVAFPGKGHQSPDEDELTRLRREVAQLKQERDFLRKAAAYFATE